MAVRGLQAFNTDDPSAPNSHAHLLIKAAEGLDEIALAHFFKVSLPTVRKWRSLPLGYKPPVRGATKKNGPTAEPVRA